MPLKPVQAALKGSREIAMAVVAMTLTLAAVFAPLAFSTGRTGKLFTEFALTLAGAVLISGFIAMGIGPDGATPAFTQRYLEVIESMVAPTPEVKSYFGIVGYPSVTDALLFADMQFWEDRTRSAQEVVGELAPQLLGGVTGLMSFAATPPPLGQDPTSKDVEIVLQTSGGYDELAGVVAAVTGQAWGHPGLNAVDTDFKPNKPELKVTLDREKTAAVGLDPAVIGRTLETLLGGREVTHFKRGAEQYGVVVQMEDAERRDPRDLSDILVRGRDGDLVQLGTLYLTGNSLNIYSQIGMVTLVGLITIHGILIVEFANQLREQGMARVEAVLQSASQRLRPILMTTAAMVLGAVPLALASGAGAEGVEPSAGSSWAVWVSVP